MWQHNSFFFAKLLFKIKLWLKLNWLNFVHVSIIILLITQILSSASSVNLFFVAPAHGDLFLWWTWNTFLFFPPLHPLLLVHHYLTTGFPWLYSKPTETQDWQFCSAACKVMNEWIISPHFLFFRCPCPLFMSCFYWSKASIALPLATLGLLVSCIYEDYEGFLGGSWANFRGIQGWFFSFFLPQNPFKSLHKDSTSL